MWCHSAPIAVATDTPELRDEAFILQFLILSIDAYERLADMSPDCSYGYRDRGRIFAC